MSELIENIPEQETKEKPVIDTDTSEKILAPNISPMARPLTIGKRAGIVTPSKQIVREPIGEGKVGLKEKVIDAPMAGLDTRVPVDTDARGRPIYGTLKEEGLASIEKQKQPISYEEFKERVFSGDITQASPAGSPYVLKNITDILKNTNDPTVKFQTEATLKSFYEYSQYKDPSQKLIRPFGEEGKFKKQESDNARLNLSKKKFFDNQTDFLNVIEGRFGQFEDPDDRTRIKQKLLNRISLGDTPKSALKVAIERFNEIPRAIPTIIPYAKYIYDYARMPFNPVLWEATRAEREKTVQEMKQALQSELGIPLLMDVINEAVVEELKLDLEKGEIDRAKFDDLTTIKVGDKIFKRQFVDEDLAVKILDQSFSQLSDDKKIGVYLFEVGMPIGGASTISIKAGAALAKNQMKVLREKVQKTFNPKESQRLLKLNDIEFLDEMKDLDLSRKADIEFLVKGINVRSLATSIELDRVTKNAKKLNEKTYLAGVKYSSLLKDPTATEGAKTAALNTYRKFYAQSLQDTIKMRTSPVLREGIKEIFPLVAAQYAGQEFLGTDGIGGDTFTGELLGVGLYMMTRGTMSFITGRVVKKADGFAGGLANNGAKIFEDITGWLYTKTGGDAMPKGWLADRSQEDYERLLGRKLNPSEKRGFEWTQKLTDYMGEENAAIVMNNIKADFQKRRYIANLFPDVLPEGQKGITSDEAYKILAGDIGETSKAQWLQTAVIFAQKNVGAFDGADPRSVGKIINLQKELESSAVAQSIAKNRILQLAKEQGIDFKDNSIVNSYVNQVEARVKYTRDFNRNFATRLKERIQLYINKIEKDPSQSSRAGLIEELKDNEIEISKIIDGKELDEFAAIDDQLANSYKNLKTSLDKVKQNRKEIALHQDQFGNTAEKLIGTTINNRLVKARVPFKKLDDEMEKADQFIDMGGLVRSLVDEEKISKGKPLSFFFSKQKDGIQFFNSPLNKKLLKSFNMMADRSLKTLPPNLKGKLEELATIEFDINGNRNPFFINKEGDFDSFDLVLKLDENSKNPDFGLQNFRPFQASAYEVNAVRSAFRDYAYRLKDKDPELSRTFVQRKDELDDLFMSKMPDKANEYANARTGYKAIVFDDQDLPNDMNKIQSGIKRTDENPSGLNFIYQAGKGPETLFDTVGDLSRKYITSGGDADFLQQIKSQFRNDARGFQTKTDNFIPVFDTSTPNGIDNLNIFKRLLQEKLYMKIGREYFDVKTTSPKRIREQAIARREGGGYLFDKEADQDIIKDIDAAFEVKIIDPNEAEPVIVSLNPLADLMEETKDIAVRVQENVELQGKLKDYLKDLKVRISASGETILNAQKSLQDDLELVARRLGDNTFEATPDGYLRFFQKNIMGGSEAKIERDKNLIVRATNLSRQRVDELYEHMTGNGLLEYGNPTAVDGGEFTPLIEGGDNIYEVFSSPQKVIQAIEDNPNSSVLLEKILKPNVLKNVSTLMKLVNGRRKLSLTRELTQQNTNLRKISQNELASRGYNIARDMVSPLYVTTEFALRIASQHGINVMNLAVTNERASELLVMIMENPSLMTKADISTVNELLTNFVVSQLTRQNITLPDFTEEGLEALRKEQDQGEDDETVQ